MLVLAILGFALPTAGAASVDAIIYPASGVVGLDPPEGMTEAPDFAGFVGEEEEGASIVIVEMPPEAFEEIAAQFDADGLARQMDVDGAPQQLTLSDDVQALLVRGRQTAHGVAYRKWALLARNSVTTALVTAQVPDGNRRYSDATILASLQSLRIRSNGSIEGQIDALPFTIGDRAGFRPVRTLAGSSLILTDGPANSYEDGSQPIVIIAASMGRDRRFADMPEEDREQLARRLADQLGFAEMALERVSGSDAAGDVILAGTAIDPKHKQQVFLRQTLRFAEAGYVRTVCVAKPEQTITARCDRIAQSVALKGAEDSGAP